MSESIVADFTARFTVTGPEDPGPKQGRVVMSRRKIVLATAEDRVTVSLSSIFDIAVGHVPPNVEEFFDDTVTIGYKADDQRRTAVIEADGELIDKFSSILFKLQLNGTDATVKHPARIGGRVTDEPPEPATLSLKDRTVAFTETNDPFSIDLHDIIHFERGRWSDSNTAVLGVRHMQAGESLTSELALEEPRKMNLLGRYLRLEYSDLQAELSDLDVGEDEMEVLVGIYSGGGEADLARLLGIDASSASMIVDSLVDKGLAARNDGSPSLTAQGRMIVGERIEDVNA